MNVRTTGSARRSRRPVTTVVVAVLLALGATIAIAAAVVGHHVIPSGSANASPPPFGGGVGAGADEADGVIDDADGLVPDGVTLTVFDDGTAAIDRLDPDLLDAVRRAATDAAADGEDVVFEVNSGWRSAEYQDSLLREAVVTYGSEDEAARWVSTPETSAHVTGDAIDIGPFDATYWLSQNGAAYGLCQIYGNESWHYELRPSATTDGCPPMYADPTEDPRMRA